MAAIWVPCACSAVVRLVILLFTPLVFMVSIFSFFIALDVLFFFPLRVLCWCVTWLFWCSSQKVTFFGLFSPFLFVSIPLGGCLFLLAVSLWFLCGCSLFFVLLEIVCCGLLFRLLFRFGWSVVSHFLVPVRYSDLPGLLLLLLVLCSTCMSRFFLLFLGFLFSLSCVW